MKIIGLLQLILTALLLLPCLGIAPSTPTLVACWQYTVLALLTLANFSQVRGYVANKVLNFEDGTSVYSSDNNESYSYWSFDLPANAINFQVDFYIAFYTPIFNICFFDAWFGRYSPDYQNENLYYSDYYLGSYSDDSTSATIGSSSSQLVHFGTSGTAQLLDYTDFISNVYKLT